MNVRPLRDRPITLSLPSTLVSKVSETIELLSAYRAKTLVSLRQES